MEEERIVSDREEDRGTGDRVETLSLSFRGLLSLFCSPFKGRLVEG